jgi:hypothetical protein
LLARTTGFEKRFMNEQATEKHARFISGYEAACTGKPAHWRMNDLLNSFLGQETMTATGLNANKTLPTSCFRGMQYAWP